MVSYDRQDAEQAQLAERVPPRVKSAWRAAVEWVKGPDPPRIFHITPVFAKMQDAPLALLDRYAPKKIQRFWLLVALYGCWLLAFSLVLRASSFSSSIPGYGSPVRLGCGNRYWDDGNGCGLNGDRCRPFTNASLAFRCPADCHKTHVLNPHAVGDQEIVYRPLVIGGPTDHQTGFEDVLVDNAIYRGDSFICGSAVHAGFIKDAEGGCGVLTLTGEQPSFTSSKHHGIESVGFDSYFPRSFGFLSGTRASCKDLRWPALAVSVFFTVVLSLFTTDPAVFFWSVFVISFFQTALATDPPNLTNYYSLLSVAFGRFLPACFCGWVTYRYTVQRTLAGLTAQVEKTFLWLGPLWVGALNNQTFDKIPIQRLTPHDIRAQPGAIPALIIVILTIFFIALGQAWSFRLEGRMPRYLLIYGLMVAALLVMISVPGLDLRIHHYILALLLLPGTSFQNRPSLLYQGLLVGLFVNGIARWGFDSILQTPGELFQGAQQGTLLPAVSVLAIGASNITFNLGPLPQYERKADVFWDGISVLVNDVERFKGYADDRSYWGDVDTGVGNYTWTWRRHRHGKHYDLNEIDDLDGGVETEAVGDIPEYFRFAYLAGSSAGDYSKAGKWASDGWTQMEPGPS
ncbi:hypothetical protein BAUCODRAFT_141375 [Baudoinia panamericana UAMH 10762]|uniref:LCCL domain-containing protein n=1 Tax=Baudoinia panamericana (strain UAMH 10762) TaxID=717646 RepID=M2N4M8_BAUPA|nr:uncharacterized protein BAUCODRAFT_141375 [Baudoinia panamericana UAMH 10762]EMC93964.1 hypothetical protein BAUCODRAFT_141375 [Baudoinia panamericana UAMH 10762]